MTYSARFTEEAEDDLHRLYAFVLERNATGFDDAEGALAASLKGVEFLKLSPFSCRKVHASNRFVRELIISSGPSGYVVLFEIEPDDVVTVLAVRHQRESDFH